MPKSLFFLICIILSFEISKAQEVIIERYKGIKYTAISGLIVDGSNTKWIGTADSVIQLKNNKDFNFKTRTPGVYTIGKGKRNNIWLALKSNIIYDIDNKKSYPININIHSTINHISVGKNEIYVSTSEGLFIISTNNTQLSDEVISIKKLDHNSGLGNVIKVYEDLLGVKWIATSKGFFSLDKKGLKLIDELSVTSMTYNEGSLWLTGNGKLWKFENLSRLRSFDLDPPFSSHKIEDLAFDSKGNLWLASTVLGMLEASTLKTKIFSTQEGFTSKHALNLVVDHEDVVWIGTEGKGLFSAFIDYSKVDTTFKSRYNYMKGYAANNLVLLLDVSNSMNDPNKLPKLKESVKQIMSKMRPEDKISIVVFSKDVKTLLPPTPCTDNLAVNQLLDTLNVSGGSNIYAGLTLAYRVLNYNFNANANNRILLATDGAYAVDDRILKVVEENKKGNSALSIFDYSRETNARKLKKLAKEGMGSYYNMGQENFDVLSILEQEIKAKQRF